MGLGRAPGRKVVEVILWEGQRTQIRGAMEDPSKDGKRQEGQSTERRMAVKNRQRQGRRGDRRDGRRGEGKRKQDRKQATPREKEAK